MNIIALLIWSTLTTADNHESVVTLAEGETFCKIEMFSPKMGAATTSAFQPCDSLKDKGEVKTKTYEACKQIALDKGSHCLKLLPKVDRLAVRGKFIERFKVRSNSTTFTCEMDKTGSSSCP